ncbi:MAG: hypothetical protein AAF620_17515 [Bacteroidota bacterium]
MELEDENLDKEVKKRVLDLNDSYPSILPNRELLWQSIEEKRGKRKIRSIQIRWSIAASVALCVVSGIWIFQTEALENNTNQDLLALFSEISEGKQAYDYIDQVCKTQSSICQSKQFQALRIELEQSSIQLDEIEKQIDLFGPDKHLINAKDRVRKHQYRIIKTLVQII